MSSSAAHTTNLTAEPQDTPHVPDFAFDPTDPWTETFQKGLTLAELAGKHVYEVGIGTGMNAVYLLQSCNAATVSGSDLDPRLAKLAARNVETLAPEHADRFKPVIGPVSLIDSEAARTQVAKADTIIACLPQVTCPKDEKFAAIRDAHDVEIDDSAQEKSADHIAHYYPWEMFDAFPFNAVGLGLNEALLRSARKAAPEARLIMNFGARIPTATICAMYEANGYAPKILHSQMVEQDAGTDISFFVTLEKAMQGTGLEAEIVCEFFADREGQEPLSASAAQARQEEAPEKPLYHRVCVVDARPC